jgi:phage host-nuclease inhibitor protein Gam
MAESKTKRAPKALWEVSKLMLALARNVFTGKRIEHSYNVRVAKLEKEKEEKLHELGARRETLVREIHSLMKANRPAVEKVAKSVTLATGQVGWREMKPSVEIVEGYEKKDIIAALQKRGKWALRFKPELNKQAILQNSRDGKHRPINGITVKTGEEFFISIAPRGNDKEPEVITL